MSTERTQILEPLRQLLLDWKMWDSRVAPVLDNVYDDIKRRTETRGFEYICISMPSACQTFDKGLSTGRLDTASLRNLLGGRSAVFNLITAYFPFGEIIGRLDPNDVFFVRTLLLMYKKLDLPHPQTTVDKAYAGFMETDSLCGTPVHDWTEDRVAFDANRIRKRRAQVDGPAGRKLLSVVWLVADILMSSFPSIDHSDLREFSPGHGPGAVAEGSKLRDKYVFQNWTHKLESIFPWDIYGVHTLSDGLVDQPRPRNHEPPARVLCVPKTLKGPRIITAEPQSYVYCQIAVLRWMRKHFHPAVKRAYLPDSQERNRAFARQGSIDGGIATVDLSEASDRLSLLTLELLCTNTSLLRILHAVRTRWAITPAGCIILKKYAGMGNATTFPVQSLIYTILCLASVLYERQWKVSRRNLLKAAESISVFGDDLIVPTDTVQTLFTLLNTFGLKVNVAKSHYSGHFRESCGLDAYHGHEVTPFYFRSLAVNTPESIASWVEVSNNAHKAGLWNLSSWMRKRQFEGKYSYLHPHVAVSNTSDLSLSFHTFSDGQLVTATRPRRTKAGVCSSSVERRTVVLSTKRVVVERASSPSLLQYFAEEPAPDTKWVAGWTKRVGLSLTLRWT